MTPPTSFGAGIRRQGKWITDATLPASPLQGRWYDYRVDVLPGSHLRFYWDGALIFEFTDPERRFSGGPVGMRLDYFDTVLAETRVYQP